MQSNKYATLPVLILLAACGGGSGAGDGLGGEPPTIPPTATPTEAFGLYDIAFTASTDALEERSNTAFVDPLIEGMPDTGTASYRGVLRAELETPGRTTFLMGQADVTANFDASSLSGSATNFVGRDTAGTFGAYDGEVALTSGTIGAGVPNDFDLDYAGTLSRDATVITLDGTVVGKFKADPILGLLGDDPAPTATVDATPTDGTVFFVVTVPDI